LTLFLSAVPCFIPTGIGLKSGSVSNVENARCAQ
jgi:hypothetical protein